VLYVIRGEEMKHKTMRNSFSANVLTVGTVSHFFEKLASHFFEKLGSRNNQRNHAQSQARNGRRIQKRTK
jgi:hypothetical protein